MIFFSITNKLGSEDEAELDICEACETSPHDGVSRRRVFCACQVRDAFRDFAGAAAPIGPPSNADPLGNQNTEVTGWERAVQIVQILGKIIAAKNAAEHSSTPSTGNASTPRYYINPFRGDVVIRRQRAFDQWKSSHDIDNNTGQGLCEKILESILSTSGDAIRCKVRSQDHRCCGCSGSYQDADSSGAYTKHSEEGGNNAQSLGATLGRS